MKFIITGSGGCVSTPKPLCKCKVCVEAREKGYPYARCGCSLFLEDISLLIDTPEDICTALNNAKIEQINYLFYSHMDPDHTLGMRVIEQLRLDWLKLSVGVKCDNPIVLGALPNVLNEIECMGTKYGSMLKYFESLNLVKCQPLNHIEINGIKITLVSVNDNENVTIFVFEDQGHKLIYAPCDVKPFPENSVFNNAEYLIIGNTIVGEVLKNNFILEKDNPLRDELFTLDDIMRIKNKYRIRNVVITHLEEDWDKTYEDYLYLQEEYQGLLFAYDGMIIDI